MKSKKSLILNIIFFGALWGLLEASLGYGLQFLPPLFSGSVMFPIAAIIMYWSYRNTKSPSAILLVALIAASIKSINFFMPGLLPIKTYNPMIAIMLQSLLVFSFVKVFERKQIGYKILSIASLSFGWRALFIANIAINHALTGFPFSQLVSSQATLSFIFLYGLMETGILFVAFLAKLGLKRKVNLEFESHWLLSFSMLLAALIVVVMPLI